MTRIAPAHLVVLAAFALARSADGTEEVALEAPRSVPRFDPAEMVIRVEDPPALNPFTDASLRGEFRAPGADPVAVDGFCDSADGKVYRLRFSSARAGVVWSYRLRLEAGPLRRELSGELACEASDRAGPVVRDPEHPKHFRHAGSRKPFYHLGYTAYHLLDPSNDDATIDATIDYCSEHGFNKIRFLLAGYPRDTDERTSGDEEHGVPDPWSRKNYGAPAGEVNPLPAWEGKPHAYDFKRFRVEHWRRAERAVRRMRERGIVATCIVTIEKQDLPAEYGRLTEDERRLYRYCVARLAAFDNVWWDLGNEHNEYRDVAWGNAMGALLEEWDPYGRLASAHGYKDFLYPESSWAGFIITQQYGTEKEVHDWALRYLPVPKPYVNEEYGYEGSGEKPGHGQNADLVRRCHWAIAMAGGYATYGDWSDGKSWFYMGEPGPGKAALELAHLREFFEALPFVELRPRDDLTTAGFCLARPPDHWVLWLPRGGEAEISLDAPAGASLRAEWFSPRDGERREEPGVRPGKIRIAAPDARDWALRVRRIESEGWSATGG